MPVCAADLTSPSPPQVAEEVYVAFDPDRCLLDSHLDAAVVAHGATHEPDELFLRQLVYGTVRYAELVRAFAAAFYHHCGGSALRSDKHM